MTEQRLFQSVYDNYEMYKNIVASIIGRNNPFVEDVISDCCLKIATHLKDGKIDINKITYGDHMSRPFFARVLRNKSIDFLKLKKNQSWLRSNIDDLEKANEEVDEFDQLMDSSIECIIEALEDRAKETQSWWYHSTIYDYYFVKRVNISELSRETGIPRHKLTNSKQILEQLITKELPSWLKERQRNQ